MSFEDFYDTLDTINPPPKKEDKTCCDNPLNYVCDDSYITCKECKNSITNIIDSPEWRYYGSEDSKGGNPVRCGMPVNVLLPKSSVGTSINTRGKNSMNKLVLYQNWNSMPYKERSKYKVFTEIDTKCRKNNLPNIISESAKSLYSTISSVKISRGNNRTGIIAACIFHACKECGVPRSIKELSEIFDIDPKVMTRGCKKYTEISRMNKTNVDRVQNIRSINLNDFIERNCNSLKLTPTDIQEIKQISEKCIDLGLTYDNTPPSMCAGCIYLYIKLKGLSITKKDISDKCIISEVTINKCYKKLESNKELMEIISQ